MNVMRADQEEAQSEARETEMSVDDEEMASRYLNQGYFSIQLLGWGYGICRKMLRYTVLSKSMNMPRVFPLNSIVN